MSTFVFKNLRQLFDKYAVALTEHDTLVKSTTKIFSNFVAFSESQPLRTKKNTVINYTNSNENPGNQYYFI